MLTEYELVARDIFCPWLAGALADASFMTAAKLGHSDCWDLKEEAIESKDKTDVKSRQLVVLRHGDDGTGFQMQRTAWRFGTGKEIALLVIAAGFFLLEPEFFSSLTLLNLAHSPSQIWFFDLTDVSPGILRRQVERKFY